MQLEDYFIFLAPDDIRVRGTRVGIETILFDYVHRDRTPEEIAESYLTLELEQVYATILYYLHNREIVGAYLKDWIDRGQRMWEESQKNPSPAALRMRKIKAERKAKNKENASEISSR